MILYILVELLFIYVDSKTYCWVATVVSFVIKYIITIGYKLANILAG